MKLFLYCSCILVMFFVCKSVSAEVTDEMFNALSDRMKSVEDTIADISKGDFVYDNSIDEKMARLEESVHGLQDRATLMDMTDEIRRIQEFVCSNGHVYSVKSADGRCPADGKKLKSRNRYKLFKFARRESISERISAAIEDELARNIILGASATGVVQQLVSSDREESSFAEGSFDLLFISQPLLYTTFFVDLESIGGNGPDELIGSFSGFNDDSGTLQDDDGVDRLSVREVWLQSFFFDQRLKLVGGKIDLTNYFDSNTVANDETTQFLSSAFVNNPTMEVPENAPGIVAFFDTRRSLSFGLGLQSDTNDGFDITNHVYAIGEIGYRSHFFFGQEGNYRLWGRINGGRNDNLGFGVSFDQNLSTRFAAFGRYGANDEESGEADIASAWSVGLRFRSPFFSRVNDEIAVAFGSLDILGGDDESITETYYKFQINDHIAITPGFQAVFDPGGVGGDDTVAMVGIRTQIEF